MNSIQSCLKEADQAISDRSEVLNTAFSELQSSLETSDKDSVVNQIITFERQDLRSFNLLRNYLSDRATSSNLSASDLDCLQVCSNELNLAANQDSLHSRSRQNNLMTTKRSYSKQQLIDSTIVDASDEYVSKIEGLPEMPELALLLGTRDYKSRELRSKILAATIYSNVNPDDFRRLYDVALTSVLSRSIDISQSEINLRKDIVPFLNEHVAELICRLRSGYIEAGDTFFHMK